MVFDKSSDLPQTSSNIDIRTRALWYLSYSPRTHSDHFKYYKFYTWLPQMPTHANTHNDASTWVAHRRIRRERRDYVAARRQTMRSHGIFFGAHTRRSPHKHTHTRFAGYTEYPTRSTRACLLQKCRHAVCARVRALSGRMGERGEGSVWVMDDVNEPMHQ